MNVFAAQKMIWPLKTLAKEELQTMLARFTLFQDRTGNIVTLLRYIYKVNSGCVADVDELCSVMSHYIGYQMNTLIKDPEFKKLLGENKDSALLEDFLKMVEKRL